MDEMKATEYKGPKVIGAGLPRTATTSLHHALETLGYNPCHTFRNYIVEDSFPYTHARTWTQISRLQDKPTRRTLLHKLYEDTGVQAAVDAPTCFFIDDLIEMYPDAKVVLGVRSSPEAWRRSFNSTIGRVMSSSVKTATSLFLGISFGLQPLLAALDDLSRQRYGHAWTDWEDVGAYTAHNEWVRSVVPKERLLEFEPKMGYEGLCGFLGVEAPKGEDGQVVAFPRENPGEGFEKALGVMVGVGWGSWAVVLGAVVWAARWLGYV